MSGLSGGHVEHERGRNDSTTQDSDSVSSRHAALLLDALRALKTPWRLRAVLALYGAAVCAFGVYHLDQRLPDKMTLQGGRAAQVAAQIQSLNQGAPLLVGTRRPYKSRGLDRQRDLYPLGLSDDLGVYVYLGELGHGVGTTNPLILLKWSFITLFALLLLLYPLIFYELLGSILFALLTPFLLLYRFSFMFDTDIYWITAWAVLFCLPLIMLIYKRWGRLSPLWLALLMIAASFASSIRINAGLPVLLAAIMVVFMREKRWLARAGIVALLVVASISISRFVFAEIDANRWQALGRPDQQEQFGRHHVIWHNMYIGLGYLPNKYGLRWDDTVGFEHAKRANPNVVFLSKDYDRSLRHLYIHILKTDPAFVAKNIVYKAAFEAGEVVRRFWIGLLLVPFMLLVGRRKHDMRHFVMFVIPALLITLAPTVLTIPYPPYATGFYAATGLVWLLALGWLFVSLPELVRNWRADVDESIRRVDAWGRSPGFVARRLAGSAAFWVLLFVGLATAVAAVTLAPVARSAYDRWYFSQQALAGSPQVLAARLAGSRLVRGWTFSGELPHGWGKLGDANVERAGTAVRVVTSGTIEAYQVWSPDVPAAPGSYYIVVEGQIRDGGMEIGALNAERDRWIHVTRYTTGKKSGHGTYMATGFSLAKPTNVRVILSNWNNGQSRWIVHRVRLLRVPPSAKNRPTN
jgi:hypothetical protein